MENDRNVLQTTYYYQKTAQKNWLVTHVDLIEEAFSENKFKYTQSRLMHEQVLLAIKEVIEIYETKDTDLIQALREIIKIQFEKTKEKLATVEKKINELSNLKNSLLKTNHSNFFKPMKDKEGFSIPLPKKNFNEKKRDFKDNNSKQSSKRTMLEQTPQKEKIENHASPSSTDEKQNNGYQSN